MNNESTSLNPHAAPVSDADWFSLQVAIQQTFTPAIPIDDSALFSGRIGILRRIVDAVFQPGRHVILHGSRGVGKSSIANVVKEKILTNKDVFHVVKRNCTTSHDFKLIWQHCLDDFTYDGKPVIEALDASHNPYDIYRYIDGVPANKKLVFIIDEFDRVDDAESQILMSDTIKYLSDYASTATIIIVGVADSVNELIEGHASIVRNIDQIEMPVMNPTELEEIITTRLSILNMSMDSPVKNSVVALSQGLPQYTHLLSMHSALEAVEDRSMVIDDQHLARGIQKALGGADQRMTDMYLKATRSSKPQNLFKEALLACALAECDERGYFNAAAVAKPYSEITGRNVSIPDYARHLSEFTKPERGPALIREGKSKSYEYRFTESLLRPYVTLRGVSENMIRRENLVSR